MKDLKDKIRKILNAETGEMWKKAMLKCSSEEIKDLSIVYDGILEDQIEYIEEQFGLELESSIHELFFAIKDFLDMIEFPSQLDTDHDGYFVVEDEDVDIVDEDYEPIDWETNIKKDFTYE